MSNERRDPALVLGEEIGWLRALDHPELLASPVAEALQALEHTHPDLADQARVCAIDPSLSDTDALNEHFRLDPDATGNCVLVAGKRAGERRVAACVVRASFLPMEQAVELSGMEYGGITPVGLPTSWRLLVDAQVAARQTVLIGSGVRASKLLVPGALLAALETAEVIQGLGIAPR